MAEPAIVPVIAVAAPAIVPVIVVAVHRDGPHKSYTETATEARQCHELRTCVGVDHTMCQWLHRDFESNRGLASPWDTQNRTPKIPKSNDKATTCCADA